MKNKIIAMGLCGLLASSNLGVSWGAAPTGKALGQLHGIFSGALLKPQDGSSNNELPDKNGLIVKTNKIPVGEKKIQGKWLTAEAATENTSFKYRTAKYEDREYIFQKGSGCSGDHWLEHYFPKTVKEYQIQKVYRIANRDAYVSSQSSYWGKIVGLPVGSVLGSAVAIGTWYLTRNSRFGFFKGLGAGLAAFVVSGLGSGYTASFIAAKNAKSAPETWREIAGTEQEVLQYHREGSRN